MLSIKLGLGWGSKNGSTGTLPSFYEFELINCSQAITTVYSSSPVYQPGIFVYTESTLTNPFDGGVGGWNFTIDDNMYFIAINGLVTEAFQTCGF